MNAIIKIFITLIVLYLFILLNAKINNKTKNYNMFVYNPCLVASIKAKI